MKEILYDLSRARARNAQHVQFATDVVAAISQEVAEARGFASQYATFTKAVANEQQCFQPNKGYLETSEIVAADTARDRLFYFYKQVVQAYADYHPDSAKQKAGEALTFVFRELGSRVAEMDYASETALLTDLVERLRQSSNASALAAIGMEDAADDLEAANEAFNTIYLKRSAEELNRAQAWKMKDLRRVTDDAFNELAKTINALYAVNELVTKDEEARAALAKVIDDVNAIVVRLKKTIGGTSGVKPGGDSTGGSDDGEAPDPVIPGGGDGEGESPDPIV